MNAAYPELVGAWDLLDCTDFHSDGTRSKPLGDAPRGQIMYSADGRVSAHLIPGGVGDTPASAYIGYYGRYTVDLGARVVTHHVLGASPTEMIGTDLQRAFRVEGDRLILEAPRPTGIARVFWQRASIRSGV